MNHYLMFRKLKLLIQGNIIPNIRKKFWSHARCSSTYPAHFNIINIYRLLLKKKNGIEEVYLKKKQKI